MEPEPSWLLVRFLSAEPQWKLCYILLSEVRIIYFDFIAPTYCLHLTFYFINFFSSAFSLIFLKEISLRLGTKIILKYIYIPRISWSNISHLPRAGFFHAPVAKFKSCSICQLCFCEHILLPLFKAVVAYFRTRCKFLQKSEPGTLFFQYAEMRVC